MKTINATLLANQKIPAGQAFATAALADNSRLHPTLVASAAPIGGNTLAVECGSFYLRLRYTAGQLAIQKISDPTVASQWTTWTNFQGTGQGTTYGIALFWTGSYVVAAWQEYTVTGDIKYSRSSDGVSWSAVAQAHAGSPAVSINISGVSAGSTNSGLVLSYANRVHFQKYNDSADTWAAADDNGFNLTDLVPQVAGFYDSINSRYILAVETNTFVSWATYAIVLFTRAVGSATWSAGQVLFATNATQHFKGLTFSQRQIGGYWWFIFAKPLNWTTQSTSNMLVSTSNDGLFWEDPSPTAIAGSGITLCLTPAPSAGTWTNAYLSNEAGAYRLDTYTYWATAPVMNYHFSTGHGITPSTAPLPALAPDPLWTPPPEPGGGSLGAPSEFHPLAGSEFHPLAGSRGHKGHKPPPPPPHWKPKPQPPRPHPPPHHRGAPPRPKPVPHPRHKPHAHPQAAPAATVGAPSSAHLVIQLDNRSGSLLTPRIFSILTLTRGLTIGGVQYGQSSGVWYVTGFRYILNDLVLEIDAIDAHGLLAAWFSHSVFTYNLQTVKQLVEAVCALAGVHTVTFDSFAAWTDQISVYSHPVGANAHYSLHSLATRIPFEFIAKEDGSLYFYVPTAAPASVYAYDGAGNHTIWPGTFGAQESVSYIQVAGGAPRTMVAEAMDNTTIYEQGRKSAQIINQRSLTVDTQATALANAAIVVAKEHKHTGAFEAPPSFALEPGDVINFAGLSTYATATGPWRVEAFEEHFNAPGPRAFFQRITVRGTA